MTRKEADLVEALFALYLKTHPVGALEARNVRTDLGMFLPPWLSLSELETHFRVKADASDRSLQRTYGALMKVCDALPLCLGGGRKSGYVLLFPEPVCGKNLLLLTRTRGPYETLWKAINVRMEDTTPIQREEQCVRAFGYTGSSDVSFVDSHLVGSWVDPLRTGVHRLRYDRKCHALANTLMQRAITVGVSDAALP